MKMDVEGAEPAALRGAKKILSTNKVKASICSYHKADDIVKIKAIFQNYGYRTATSAGYMIYIWDEKIWETLDFRKGIVYATNCSTISTLAKCRINWYDSKNFGRKICNEKELIGFSC